MNDLELTGRTRTHISQFDSPRFAAHPDVVNAFLSMRKSAFEAGIILEPFSSFRDFRMQLRIWNKKFRGEKPLYDINGVPRDFSCLTAPERILSILNWSALPGGSRHHWGTEIDVFDSSKVPSDYRVQLLPCEVESGGVFNHLHQWLDTNMRDFGFFRPYAFNQGGMYPEPWHLSFFEISEPALDELTLEILEEAISSNAIEGKEVLLKMLPDLYDQHVRNICPRDP
jgi:LAS superfamily LD-carboxypeptidase LdcB